MSTWYTTQIEYKTMSKADHQPLRCSASQKFLHTIKHNGPFWSCKTENTLARQEKGLFLLSKIFFFSCSAIFLVHNFIYNMMFKKSKQLSKAILKQQVLFKNHFSSSLKKQHSIVISDFNSTSADFCCLFKKYMHCILYELLLSSFGLNQCYHRSNEGG